MYLILLSNCSVVTLKLPFSFIIDLLQIYMYKSPYHKYYIHIYMYTKLRATLHLSHRHLPFLIHPEMLYAFEKINNFKPREY